MVSYKQYSFSEIERDSINSIFLNVTNFEPSVCKIICIEKASFITS